jgi:hypothetical protein
VLDGGQPVVAQVVGGGVRGGALGLLKLLQPQRLGGLAAEEAQLARLGALCAHAHQGGDHLWLRQQRAEAELAEPVGKRAAVVAGRDSDKRRRA